MLENMNELESKQPFEYLLPKDLELQHKNILRELVKVTKLGEKLDSECLLS